MKRWQPRQGRRDALRIARRRGRPEGTAGDVKPESFRCRAGGDDVLDSRSFIKERDVRLAVAYRGSPGTRDAARVRIQKTGERELPAADLQRVRAKMRAIRPGAELDPLVAFVRPRRIGENLGDARVFHLTSVTDRGKGRMLPA